ALLRRQGALGMALPNLAEGPQHHGAGQTCNRRPVASQRLPSLLAPAITPLGAAEDEPRDPRSNPQDEPGKPSLGRTPHPWRAAQTRHRREPGHGWQISGMATQGPLPDLALVPAQSPA